jgi:hypothetical protein
MIKIKSHLHMFQRIFKSTKFALNLYIFIFAIEQDISVTRSNELLKSRSIARGYQLVLLYIKRACLARWPGCPRQPNYFQSFDGDQTVLRAPNKLSTRASSLSLFSIRSFHLLCFPSHVSRSRTFSSLP